MFLRHEKFNFLARSASALDITCIRCMLYSQVAIPVILNFLQYIPHSLTVLKFRFIIRPGEDFESALNRADHALYKGKQQGRNQIILAS